MTLTAGRKILTTVAFGLCGLALAGSIDAQTAAQRTLEELRRPGGDAKAWPDPVISRKVTMPWLLRRLDGAGLGR